MKRYFFYLCAVVFLFACVGGEVLAQNVSPDGLKLENFMVTQGSGFGIKVNFKLRNTLGRDITFDSNGVFVGCRWNSTTDKNNRDFGHTKRNGVLRAGETLEFVAEKRLDAAGEWRFWPAYHLNGHYGPFRWNEKVITLTETPPKPKKPKSGR